MISCIRANYQSTPYHYKYIIELESIGNHDDVEAIFRNIFRTWNNNKFDVSANMDVARNPFDVYSRLKQILG